MLCVSGNLDVAGLGRRRRTSWRNLPGHLEGLWEAKPWDSEFNPWTKAGQAFSVKGLRVNILSFVGRIQALLPFLLLFIFYFLQSYKNGKPLLARRPHKRRRQAGFGFGAGLPPLWLQCAAQGLGDKRGNESRFKSNIRSPEGADSGRRERHAPICHVRLSVQELEADGRPLGSDRLFLAVLRARRTPGQEAAIPHARGTQEKVLSA